MLLLMLGLRWQNSFPRLKPKRCKNSATKETPAIICMARIAIIFFDCPNPTL